MRICADEAFEHVGYAVSVGVGANPADARVELEPATEGSPGAPLPRPAGRRLDPARSEAEEVRTLVGMTGEDRPGVDRVPRLEAQAAAAVAALLGGERAGAAHRGERTTRNQWPASSTSPPPSSASSSEGVNQRL